MKIDILDLEGKKTKSIDLPSQFNEYYEPGLIIRAIISIHNRLRQKYGADPRAGFKHAATLSRRRRDYKGSYGKGISRVPRKILWRRGMQFGWAGAEAPGTRGGRKAHPAKAAKDWETKINKKEKSKAMRSVLAGLLENKKVFAVVNDLENLTKTKEVENTLGKMGFKEELGRVKEKTIRSGKGKMRGRKYKIKRGPLVVVGGECKTLNALKNVQGCEIAVVNSLNPSLVAARNGDLRQVIFTENALNKMSKDGLFRMENK